MGRIWRWHLFWQGPRLDGSLRGRCLQTDGRVGGEERSLRVRVADRQRAGRPHFAQLAAAN
eukprot:10089197-Alexandrium_andersonii.AAC.1